MNKNEQSYDVIVVGAGNAALTAALAANEHGVKVVVLEKAPFELRGGNTRFSGGLMRFAYNGEKDVMELMPNLTSKELSKLDMGTYWANRKPPPAIAH